MEFKVHGFKIGVAVTKYKDGNEVFRKPLADLTPEEQKEFNYNATLNYARALFEDANHTVRLTVAE